MTEERPRAGAAGNDPRRGRHDDRSRADTDRSRAVARVALALALVAVSALLPSFATGAAAGEVSVTSATRSEAQVLADPAARAWGDVSPTTVPLASAPSTVPDANDTTIESLTVQAARSETRLFLRLSWRDETRDGNLTPGRIDAFADAAAVQLPVNASGEPGIAMGSPSAMVNVWWWSGEDASQELLAGGPGSTTRFADAAVTSNATYRDGQWHVVFVRDLATDAANRTDLSVEQDVDVAFAVWNGSNKERAGRKAVSGWQYLPFGPGPAGPPYESVLWTIAGIAIVVAVAVTAMAVQRGGG